MMSARSFQLGIVLAPSLPHFVHRIRGPKDGTGVSSGQRSTLTSVWYPQALQVSRARARRSGACCRASSAGSAPHPCPTSNLNTDREKKKERPHKLVLVTKPIIFSVMPYGAPAWVPV